MSNQVNVTMIPAKAKTPENSDKYHQLRIAAFYRARGTVKQLQGSDSLSYQKKKEWTLAGIFANEGFSGTQTKKRTEFNRMIRIRKLIL